MTHFNHDWTDDTVAVPRSVGDRFYAQDLNDDFNYLKHLPYEAILQGRTRGVMIPPTDTWNANSHSLTLSGGFGVVALNTPVLDVNENFVIPPKTTSVSRFERVAFSNATLILPNDRSVHYIVATPTKRSLLQRRKAILSENYACRVKYDGVITIQNTAPTTNQILIGLCHDNEYLLCKDFVFNQGIDTIKLHKWYGKNKITNSLVPLLKSYYNTDVSNIETHIIIGSVSGNGISVGISDGIFDNCTITISTVSGIGKYGISNSSFNNCAIIIGSVSGDGNYGISDGSFDNCTIRIGSVSGGGGGSVSGNGNYGISDGSFDNCTIRIGSVSGGGSGSVSGIGSGDADSTFNNCAIIINTVSGNGKYGISDGSFDNCTITISTVSGIGISVGTFNKCAIRIGSVSGGGGISSGIFSNCTINIDTINSGNGINNGTYNNCTININTTNNISIYSGIFSNCTIRIGSVSGGGINNGTYNNCTINIDTINSGYGINNGTYNNCTINIDTTKRSGINIGTFNSCIITIGTVGGNGISNGTNVVLYLTRIECASISDLSNTTGKLNILNGTIFHAN